MEILVPVIGGISTAAFVLFILEPRRSSLLRSYLEKRRIRKFEDQLVDALTSISNCLKAGLSLMQAIETLEREMDAPASEEFGLVSREHRMGVSLEESIRSDRRASGLKGFP